MIGLRLRRCDQRHTAIFAEKSGKGLTWPQFTILSALATIEAEQRRQRAEKKGATQHELVEATGIDRCTLSEILTRLDFERKVTRTRGIKDARTKLVSITTVGRFALTGAKRAARDTEFEFLKSVPRAMRANFVKALEAAAQFGERP